MLNTILLFLFCLFLNIPLLTGTSPRVRVGIDCLMEEKYNELLKGKKIGLVTNQTGVSSSLESSIDVIKKNASSKGYTLVALFAPEHGINGMAYAEVSIKEARDSDNLPIYSLHGETRRPTEEMLKNITLLVYDIQDIGSRSYTYASTLFYAMEEAAKRNIPVVVLDRPNPINGVTVDGLMLDPQWRSFIGYINVPYCHGMTIGELARYFNGEYEIGCKLEVVAMEGWQRRMTFQETGLPWIPTSPYIPEATTPFFYPMTGILGELQLVNIGIGYTMPFKIVGAPWINAKQFAASLNEQKFSGVWFSPIYFSPVYGRYAKEQCEGVQIIVTDPLLFKPVSTQYLIIGILKSLYPEKFQLAIAAAKKRKATLCKLNGIEEAYRILVEERHIAWKLCSLHMSERSQFMQKRKKYLLY